MSGDAQEEQLDNLLVLPVLEGEMSSVAALSAGDPGGGARLGMVSIPVGSSLC